MALLPFDPAQIARESLGGIYTNALGNLSPLNREGKLQLAIANDPIKQIPEYDFKPALSAIETIGLILSIGLGLVLVFVLLRLSRYWEEKAIMLREVVQPPKPGEDVYEIRWHEVRRHIASQNDSEWKFAVIEADKIVDDVLRKTGYPGEMQSLENLWSAHKLRNIIAHNPDYQVRYAEAHEAIQNYEKALKELGELG